SDLEPPMRRLALGDLAAGEIGANRERGDPEAEREAQLDRIPTPHRHHHELHNCFANRPVDHSPSVFPSSRTLCAIRLCRANSSMKPGLALCEKPPPDSPKLASERS